MCVFSVVVFHPAAPKPPPPGAVAVFPPGGFPLINSAKQGLGYTGGCVLNKLGSDAYMPVHYDAGLN